MKKNLITVIILALVVANLSLTAILVFTIIPQTKKSTQLIDQSDGYKTYGGSEGLAAKETIIQSEINTIVNGYTLDEFDANGYQNVKDDILKSMQDMFGGSDFIVGVNFSSVQTE